MKEIGRVPPELGLGKDPSPIHWLGFPACGEMSKGHVWVDFYIHPVPANDFLTAARRGGALRWVEKLADRSVSEATIDGVDLALGWGALTKLVTGHGQSFVEKNPDLGPSISSTHGDAGTASLVLEALRLSGVRANFTASVIGANGAIGDLVSRALPTLSPSAIQLVGRPDKVGQNKNMNRLVELASRINSNGVKIDVEYNCPNSEGFYPAAAFKSDVVIVATNGFTLKPDHVPDKALVLDLCTPAACDPRDDWSGKLVLTSGCGELPESMLPDGFGNIDGETVFDVGAGGSRILWGCAIETIVRQLLSKRGHVAGTPIPLSELHWSASSFGQFGIRPQPPLSFGSSLSWEEVRQFMHNSHF